MRYLLFRPHLAALLLPALSLPVLAQSSVNIGGMVDVGIYRDAAKTWNVGTIQRSTLAFTGKEDLGGGPSAFLTRSTRTGVHADLAHKKFVGDSVNVYGAGVAHTF